MAKRLNKNEEVKGVSVWLITYADMMTIMFVFFVLLFSMSTINPVTWDVLVQTWGNRDRTVAAFGGADMLDVTDHELMMHLDAILLAMLEELDLEGMFQEPDVEPGVEAVEEVEAGYEFEVIYVIISRFIHEYGYQDRIEIERDENYIMLRFRDRAFFAPGSSTMEAAGVVATQFIGAAIGLVVDQVDTIIIEGHTDSVPHSCSRFRDNWELGAGRANSVRLILEEEGIPVDRRIMEIRSLADTVPRGDNETVEGRSENRRVEIYITRRTPEAEEVTPDFMIDGSAGETGLPEASGDAAGEYVGGNASNE